MRYRPRKLRELIIYVSQKCQTHERYGKVKLNKILFFADFIAFKKWGDSITGASYFKLPHGPAPRAMKPLFGEMVRFKEIAISPRDAYGYIEERPTPLRRADLSLFTPDEIDLVNEVVEAFKGKTGDEVSELSHLYIGYDLVGLEMDIPYFTVYCKHPDKSDITADDVQFARHLEGRP